MQALPHLTEPWHQAVGGKQQPDGDQPHADQHRRIHRHTDHLVTHVCGTDKHGDVRQHTRDDGSATQPKGKRVMKREAVGGHFVCLNRGGSPLAKSFSKVFDGAQPNGTKISSGRIER
ncbi:hypothetical protein D9M69_719520 [compost metagenome]